GQAKAKVSSSDTATERRDRNGAVVESSHQTQDTEYFYLNGRLYRAEGNGTTDSGSNELVWTTDDNGDMRLVPNTSHTYGTSDTTTERRDRNGQIVESSHQTQDTIYFYQEGRLFRAVGSGTTDSGSNEMIWTTDNNGVMSLVLNTSHTSGTTHTTFIILEGQA